MKLLDSGLALGLPKSTSLDPEMFQGAAITDAPCVLYLAALDVFEAFEGISIPETPVEIRPPRYGHHIEWHHILAQDWRISRVKGGCWVRTENITANSA